MAEMYFTQSPYNYVGNNPVNNTDVAGLFIQRHERIEWENSISESGLFSGGGSSLSNIINQGYAGDAAWMSFMDNATYISGVGYVNKNDVVNVKNGESGWSNLQKLEMAGLSGYYATINGQVASIVIDGFGRFNFGGGDPPSNASSGGNWLSDVWNSALGRVIVPDFLAVGIGFSGMAGVGGATTVEARWVTRGTEASWKPMITVTQSIGVGYQIDATLNLEAANYIGDVNDIIRSMMQTSTPNGDFPTIWGAGGVAFGGKIGATGYFTPYNGSVIVGRELNLGIGLPAGPFPVNGAGGVSNTWILHDFY